MNKLTGFEDGLPPKKNELNLKQNLEQSKNESELQPFNSFLEKSHPEEEITSLDKALIEHSLNFQDWLETVNLRGTQEIANSNQKLDSSHRDTFQLGPLRIIAQFKNKLQGLKIVEVVEIDRGFSREIFLGGNVDSPKLGDRLIGNNTFLPIKGWVMARKVQPKTVKILFHGFSLIETQINVLRPDVSSAFCINNGGHLWGYSTSVDIKKMPNKFTLHIRAVFPDETESFLAFIKFRKN